LSVKKHKFSAPGRIEICGNHTDHQHGLVLTAAIDLESVCVASVNNTNVIKITSDVLDPISVDLTELIPQANEVGTAAALLRGVASWLYENGYKIGGFDGHISSEIPIGAGLSSSAAFEVLIGNIFKGLFGLDISSLDIAIAGQFAENVYFGKPCGLMDQLASSLGGLMTIDFCNKANPVVTPIGADFKGFVLCILDTGKTHTNLTDDYAEIPFEMKKIAEHFGKEVLREVDPNEFYINIRHLRTYGDRAILRAIHFFEENERVKKQVLALKNNDILGFLSLITESGRSSLSYLQNVYRACTPSEQGLTLALALCERFLGAEGAYRVHGGGFAGTVLTFIPEGMEEDFVRLMSDIFGDSCCRFLNIRGTAKC